MDSAAIAIPVLPGKEAVLRAFTAELQGRIDEFGDSRKALGFTLERGFLMTTPQGTIATFYGEGKNLEQAADKLRASTAPIAKLFIEKLAEIHGIDLRQPAPPPPEILIDWSEGTTRKTGLAFSAPLRPGKTDAMVKFSAEVSGPRKAGMAESRRAKGVNKERVFFHRGTPIGDIVCVYFEGDDPVAANKEFAASTLAFDVWFKENVSDFFGIDFSQPLPPIEQVWDWEAR